MSQPWDFLQGTLERVRNSRGKRAIDVRTIEVLLHIYKTIKFRFLFYFPQYSGIIWKNIQ